MILSAQTIWRLCKVLPHMQHRPMLTPFEEEEKIAHGMSYGLSACGYDIRLDAAVRLLPDDFLLGSSLERFVMPDDVMAVVHDKSTLARRGLSVFNTVIKPGWEGYLTLELKNQGIDIINLEAGSPIAQIVFQRLDRPTMIPYRGKYQNQGAGPKEPIHEQDQATS